MKNNICLLRHWEQFCICMLEWRTYMFASGYMDVHMQVQIWKPAEAKRECCSSEAICCLLWSTFVCLLFIWDNVLHWDLKSCGKAIATVGQWAPRPAYLSSLSKNYMQNPAQPTPSFPENQKFNLVLLC